MFLIQNRYKGAITHHEDSRFLLVIGILTILADAGSEWKKKRNEF
jgi:hypothetical protein